MPTTSIVVISGWPALVGGAISLALAVIMLIAARPTPDGQTARFVRGWVTVYALIFTALFGVGASAFASGIGTTDGAALPTAIGVALLVAAVLARRIVRRRQRGGPVLIVDNAVPPEPQRPP